MDLAPRPPSAIVVGPPTGPRPAVVALADPDATDPGRVGAKAATLAVLAQSGVPVPDGFVVAIDAFRRCLDASGTLGELERIEAAVEPSDPADLLRCSTRLSRLIRAASLTPTVRREILDAYLHLSAKVGGGGMAVAVAVRPSIPGASPRASFAGVARTSTNILGGPDLLRRIVDCWSSNVAPRAIAYRRSCGVGGPSDVAVLVQIMIMSDRSAVASGRDPTDHSAGHVLIEAARGLGEVIADGAIVPDRYRADRAAGTIVSSTPGRQDHQVVATRGWSNRRLPLSPVRGRAVLRSSEVLAIAETVGRVEERLGGPHVVDVAIDGHGDLVVLQARPCDLVRERPAAPVPPRAAPEPHAPGGAPARREGIGASPGVATGPARIVRASEMACVDRGAVLVTPTAVMACIPALDHVAAVVTDRGGAFANLAFVCRERGIPAVVGTGTASEELTPGAMVTVDGDRGIVT